MLLPLFLLSASSLAFEILVVRLFSVTQWHHLTFMVVSVAMFGFGAGGSILALMHRRVARWIAGEGTGSVIVALTGGYGTTGLGAFFAIRFLPLDAFQVLLDGTQLLYLVIIYILLVTPFLFVGMAVAVGFAALPERVGAVYGATMAGSGAGALLPWLGIPVVGAEALALLTFCLPLFWVAVRLRRPGRRWFGAGAAGAGLICLGLAALHPAFLEVAPSSYKPMRHTLQLPDARRVSSVAGLRGRVDEIATAHVRFAPGLSLGFTGTLPPQRVLFRDGDTRLVLYDASSPEEWAFARESLSFAAYALARTRESALVIQAGGGSALACALGAAVPGIRVVEPDPTFARQVAAHDGVAVSNTAMRHFLARDQRRYDVVHLENWDAALPGATALRQDHTLTVEAVRACLRHLTPGGIFVFSRALRLPPSDLLRMAATAADAMGELGIVDPARRIAVVRNWQYYALLVSREETAWEDLYAFAEERSFDMVWAGGPPAQGVNRYNILDQPYYRDALAGLFAAEAAGRRERFLSAWPVDAAPRTDDRPYPGRMIKWSRVADLYRMTGSRATTLMMSGELVTGVLLVIGIGISLVLLLLPAGRAGPAEAGRLPGVLALFLALGIGFMAAEIYLIKALVLLTGHEAVSLTVVLSGLLTASALGGWRSMGLSDSWFRRAAALLTLLCFGYAVALPAITTALLGCGAVWRIGAAFLMLAPIGVALGMPFGLAMRRVANRPLVCVYAWAANGCGSVLGAILSEHVAMAYGLSRIMAGAGCAYAAALLFRRLGQGTDV